VLGRLITRVALVAIAFVYLTPHITGVRFHGDWWGALSASVLFNAAFWGLECLFAVIVFGINIGTLGLGAFLTGTIKFVAALLSPSLALCGVAQMMPNVVRFGNYYPDTLVFGFALGGLLWASLPEKKQKAKREG
jgi:hypothetical protein